VDVPLSGRGFARKHAGISVQSPTRCPSSQTLLLENARCTSYHSTTPRVITVDKNAAYPKALKELNAAGANPEGCELRQIKYLNNIVEQDHRFIKRLVKPWLGFFSYESAWRTLQGYEVMNMMRKGQVRGINKGDSISQRVFIAVLFGVAS